MVRPSYTHPQATLAYFPHSPESLAVAAADPDMAALIERVGEVFVDIELDGFVSLARAIVDQQISLAAARTIWGRFEQMVTGGQIPVHPDAVLGYDVEALRSCGLSRSKAGYILDLAQRVTDGSLDFDALALLNDEAVIVELTKVRGIGRWTAEMFLIFSLQRPDVFAVDDGGLRRAVAQLKGLDGDVPPALIGAIAEEWAPYRTCAALYLWRGLGQDALQSL